MQLTIKGHIYAMQNPWETKPNFTFFDFPASDWVPVMAHEITVEIPDTFDIRPGLVSNLEREKEKLSREFNAKVMEINQEIQSLLAIENKPTTMTEAESASDIPF
jgi:hypothetical protein